jgi:hypothetical protein
MAGCIQLYLHFPSTVCVLAILCVCVLLSNGTSWQFTGSILDLLYVFGCEVSHPLRFSWRVMVFLYSFMLRLLSRVRQLPLQLSWDVSGDSHINVWITLYVSDVTCFCGALRIDAFYLLAVSFFACLFIFVFHLLTFLSCRVLDYWLHVFQQSTGTLSVLLLSCYVLL